jgi:hypothetical protein
MLPSATRLRRLTAADWLLLAAAAAAQIAAYCALNAVPLSRLGSRAARMRPLARVLLKGSDERVIWAIEATGRRLRGASTCLVRAMVAEIRFASPDRAVRLEIGIRRASGGALESHAWVSDRDRVLIGGPIAPDFVRLVAWEPAA